MQEPYHIKVSLQEYYRLTKSGEWTVPDFSAKCLICAAKDCARYHGTYERGATCPITGFEESDLVVLRFLCNRKGVKSKCDHGTFSLLPLVLVPYRRLTLGFLVLAVSLRLRQRLSLFDAMNTIEETLVNLADIGGFLNIASQLQWEKMMKLALRRFIGSDMSKQQQFSITRETPEEGLVAFLQMAIEYRTRQANPPIRGPDGLNWDFYHSSGGSAQLAPFLFGAASQHRD
jgi:hypothetical protein